MNIVILDGYCLNPGDLSWQGFEELGLCKIYDRTRPEEVLERAKGAEILITNKTVLDADIMDNLPSLRYIGVLATGYNVVDIQAAARHGITVTNIPAYSTDSVAQAVFAHIFNILYDISHYTEQNRRGVWQAKGDFCYWDTPLGGTGRQANRHCWNGQYRTCGGETGESVRHGDLYMYFGEHQPAAGRDYQSGAGSIVPGM